MLGPWLSYTTLLRLTGPSMKRRPEAWEVVRHSRVLMTLSVTVGHYVHGMHLPGSLTQPRTSPSPHSEFFLYTPPSITSKNTIITSVRGHFSWAIAYGSDTAAVVKSHPLLLQPDTLGFQALTHLPRIHIGAVSLVEEKLSGTLSLLLPISYILMFKD